MRLMIRNVGPRCVFFRAGVEAVKSAEEQAQGCNSNNYDVISSKSIPR